VPEANSLGLAMLGGESVDAALQAVIDGKADAIVVPENDCIPYRQSPVDAALIAAKVLIVADHQKRPPAIARTWFCQLPAAEGDGTWLPKARPAFLPGLRSGSN
jgi:NADH-quinone oxidoreductase subunit G